MDNLEQNLLDSIKSKTTSKQILETIFSTLVEFNSNLSILVGNNYGKTVNMLNLLHLAKTRFEKISIRIDKYYNTLNDLFVKMIKLGKKNKEIRGDIDTNDLSLDLIAWIEGLFALSTIYSSCNIITMRNTLYDNMWKTISISDAKKNNIFKKKNLSKTISLSTKW